MIRARDLVTEIDAINIALETNAHSADPAASDSLYRLRHHCIQSSTNALDALKIMAERGTCALLVMHHDRLVGLVTEQDYARKVANQRRCSTATQVSSIMSPCPETVQADTTVEDCLEVANDRRVQYLCVVDDEQILGLISIADISRALVGHRERNIRSLTHYMMAESQAF